jgi:hypothetical protein
VAVYKHRLIIQRADTGGLQMPVDARLDPDVPSIPLHLLLEEVAGAETGDHAVRHLVRPVLCA